MPILVSSALLMLSLAWALYDEMVSLRPWRDYQRQFAQLYSSYLAREAPSQRKLEEAIRNSPEYRKLQGEYDAAVASAKPRKEAIAREKDYVRRRLLAISGLYQEKKALIGSYIYKWEIASERSKQSWEKDIDAEKRGPYGITVPRLDGGTEVKSYTYDELDREFLTLKERQAALGSEEAEADRVVSDLGKQLRTYFEDRMIGPTPAQMSSLTAAVGRMSISMRQINVERAGLVDRCQSCHVAMDPSLVPPTLRLTKTALGLDKSAPLPFTSHSPELLKIHDPERFGCSPCHGGNGRATSSVVKGHGRHKYWLWPLYYPENIEAGCQQCHSPDMVTEMAPRLNRGKELFREKGCIGCHRYEGFDNEGEQLLSARQLLRQLTQQKKELELEVPRVVQSADRAEDNATAQQLYAKADGMRVAASALDARMEQLNLKAGSLMREEKKVGPSLKEVRMKINRAWIPAWLKGTHDFRPTTKMPMFRLQDDEIQAISAFIWQSAVTGPALPKQPAGDPARGKVAFESRGCLACHSMGEGDKALGGDFAANLSRVGEKDHYDYLVRWIHNPRERTRPYCALEKRDLGPEDYAKKGLPFVFDLDHSQCPNDGSQLQVQQPTVMPNLRLTIQEARDIASYLMQQKRSGASYPPADFMDDPKLKERGRFLARNYGCAGCHEITTLEEEGRIGTELTTEGSKPIERLDFALLTHAAERGYQVDGKTPHPRGKWYDQKGFFEAKLANPAIFDQGKFKPNPLDRLKMPKPNLSADDITALTTFLLGSVDPQFPPDFKYKPADPRRDVQEGWWLVTKYNCMGCHQVQIGQQTALQNLPQFKGENKDKLPPPLLSEGARVDPNWLARFLENPAMSKTDTSRNGVRSYLQVRMPTFSFSENEIRKIVRFFEAASAQAQPYLPAKLPPLTDQERTLARALFTHPAAPCLKCHATGVPSHDANATAPNFLLAAERLRPAWTTRWLLDPAKIAPGTAMPSGLFRKEGDRWVFAGPQPAGFQNYSKDHAELLVRYMFQLTPEEQRMLIGRSPSSSGAGAGKK
jgi:cytochrome c551/c552